MGTPMGTRKRMNPESVVFIEVDKGGSTPAGSTMHAFKVLINKLLTKV